MFKINCCIPFPTDAVSDYNVVADRDGLAGHEGHRTCDMFSFIATLLYYSIVYKLNCQNDSILQCWYSYFQLYSPMVSTIVGML